MAQRGERQQNGCELPPPAPPGSKDDWLGCGIVLLALLGLAVGLVTMAFYATSWA